MNVPLTLEYMEYKINDSNNLMDPRMVVEIKKEGQKLVDKWYKAANIYVNGCLSEPYYPNVKFTGASEQALHDFFMHRDVLKKWIDHFGGDFRDISKYLFLDGTVDVKESRKKILEYIKTQM